MDKTGASICHTLNSFGRLVNGELMEKAPPGLNLPVPLKSRPESPSLHAGTSPEKPTTTEILLCWNVLPRSSSGHGHEKRFMEAGPSRALRSLLVPAYPSSDTQILGVSAVQRTGRAQTSKSTGAFLGQGRGSVMAKTKLLSSSPLNKDQRCIGTAWEDERG